MLLHVLFSFAFSYAPTVYYTSPTLQSKGLDPTKRDKEYTIQDDRGEAIAVFALNGKDGVRYWYRRVFTEVCLTGECRPVDVGLYWQFTGKYLGIEVYGEPLTKTDHSNFSPMDYARLESILRNEWSDLREYTAEELVEPAGPADEGVDGVTGATRRAVSEAAVKDAVYTTHTIWHLIHVGEPEQLALLTLREIAAEPSLARGLLASPDPGDRDFVLHGVVDGHLMPDSATESVVFKGLLASDRVFRDLSIRAFAKLDLSKDRIQDGLAETYSQLNASEKARVLTGLEQVNKLSSSLRTQLFSEFKSNTTPWILLKILQIFQKIPIMLTEEEHRILADFKTNHEALQHALHAMLGFK